MSKVVNYTDEQLNEFRDRYEENLETFKKRFLLFFIGLCGMGLGIVINAFGAMGVGTVVLFAGAVAWCAPLVVKFWFSGFGSLFDFQYRVYEVYQDGRKKDVTTVGEMMTGPFVKCGVALIVAVIALYLVPAEIIVRLFNHIRFEKKLGIKGTIVQAPRLHALLTFAVIVAIIIVGTIGNIVDTKKENTSDISDEEIVELLETLESKKLAYKIAKFENGSLNVYGIVAEINGTITFTVSEALKCTKYSEEQRDYLEYTLNPGTYTYINGAWIGADENATVVLSYFALGLAFDFDTMKADTSQIVVNEDPGLGYYYDTEQHDYYEIKPKKNSELQFEEFMVEKNLTFATFADGYNYIYTFK